MQRDSAQVGGGGLSADKLPFLARSYWMWVTGQAPLLLLFPEAAVAEEEVVVGFLFFFFKNHGF